jgi:long-subunit fatty acid transport protein
MQTASVSAVGLALLLSALSASGIGLSEDGAGGRAAGMGGIGTAVADDPLSALFENPAALADLGPRPQVQADGVAGFLGGSFHDRFNPDASLGSAAGLGEFAASVPVGPVSFAAGVNPEQAARVSGRYTDPPGGADGATTYGNTRDTSELLLLRSALGAGYRIAPNLFVGLSAGLLYNYNELQTNYVFQSQPAWRSATRARNWTISGWAQRAMTSRTTHR